MTAPRCLCGRPLPERRANLTPAKVCSYWCGLVAAGTFTLAQVEPMLSQIRDSIVADPDTLPMEAS